MLTKEEARKLLDALTGMDVPYEDFGMSGEEWETIQSKLRRSSHEGTGTGAPPGPELHEQAKAVPGLLPPEVGRRAEGLRSAAREMVGVLSKFCLCKKCLGCRETADQFYAEVLEAKTALGAALAGTGKIVREEEVKAVVLTVYRDGGGDVCYHAGPEGDFDREVGHAHDDECRNVGCPRDAAEVLKRFWIDGKIVKEEES